jgi:hypothetical protein
MVGRMTRGVRPSTEAAGVGRWLCDAADYAVAVLPQSLPSASRQSRRILAPAIGPDNGPTANPRRKGWSENSCGWGPGGQEFDVAEASESGFTPGERGGSGGSVHSVRM